jgi:hypothetical protein
LLTKDEARRIAVNIAKLPALARYRRQAAAVPMASAKCQSEGALFVVRRSLYELIRNIEAKNVPISFSLGNYFFVHGTHPVFA